jgi:NADH-quinone oxidoreductase subunit A
VFIAQTPGQGIKGMQFSAFPIFIFAACVFGLAGILLVLANVFNPSRPSRVKRMPYESGMDLFHDTRRRFDVRFYLIAIAFLVFDVELLFLYPWAVATRPAPLQDAPATQSPTDRQTAPSVTPGIDAAVGKRWGVESRDLVFAGAMLFVVLLVLGFVYDWRKGVFQWR